ncbi:3-isopropylmalate dehydratase small subunit [Caballeronia sp. GAWG1-1]|uniref:3-isopropylmalate dehydratase small subunit n=1 Tax=Caballeronia sp. GAWG1-1 TaxID=2921742 RepID=UPI002027E4B6|nr:3-isopropylmalate dehydratase small subunit [Caballeronia sp. GAWG1-1]
MQPFVILDAIAAPLDRPNVDTDQILPSRFLRRPRKDSFASFLFRDLRFNADGMEDPAFVLNQAPYRHAQILVADRNFGGGSSREQAPWGLVDYGIRCVIAADFGDIFYRNSLKSGLLPLQLDQSVCVALREHLHAFPGATLCIDLPQQRVMVLDGTHHEFRIDPFSKRCLLEGLDDVGFTLQYDADISSFERSYEERFAWLFDSKS